MEREAKKEKSIGIGTTTFFLSCFGISIYDQASYDSYTNYLSVSSFAPGNSNKFDWLGLSSGDQ